MPYKDLKKKKEYYCRHKKHYDKEWKKENSDKWNVYQKDYKLDRKKKLVKDIKDGVRELDICDEKELGFKAAVVLFFMALTGIKKQWAIAYRLKYDLKDVKTIFCNWEKYGVYKNGIFYLENEIFEQNIIELSLVCLVGTGEIGRCEI